MRLVGRAKRLLRLALLVVLVGLLDLEDGKELPALVRQRNPVAPAGGVDCKTHRQRPRKTVREPHRVQHGLVVLVTHEAFERRQRARGDHVQVGELA